MLVLRESTLKDQPTVKAEDLERIINEMEAGQQQDLWLEHPRPDELLHDLLRFFRLMIAAGGLVQAQGKLLMIKRRGVWDMPKGKVEQGEDISTAAIREVQEETGLQGELEMELESPLITWHTFRADGQRILKKTYWFKMQASEQERGKPQAEEEIEEVRWMKAADALEAVKPSYRNLHNLLRTVFGKEIRR